jgi:bifunctional ADP-heptose synthase (sugar kinase/adenylyltransferase)
MCAARLSDVSWPGQPVVATLPQATPTVGKLEQTPAMASLTGGVVMPRIGQPQTMIAGAPAVMPCPYRVRHPDRST